MTVHFHKTRGSPDSQLLKTHGGCSFVGSLLDRKKPLRSQSKNTVHSNNRHDALRNLDNKHFELFQEDLCQAKILQHSAHLSLIWVSCVQKHPIEREDYISCNSSISACYSAICLSPLWGMGSTVPSQRPDQIQATCICLGSQQAAQSILGPL